MFIGLVHKYLCHHVGQQLFTKLPYTMKLYVDIGPKVFTRGMLYIALSQVKTFQD